MRTIISFALVLIMLMTTTCLAESILPSLSEPAPEEETPEAVVMPSLEQVSWYDHESVKMNDDGRLVYHYSYVSENAYQALGRAMAEAGYSLKDSTTEENGDFRFLAGNDAVEMEIVYHGVGGNMDIYYPENAVLKERSEEALTVHLAMGEPFLTTKEYSYALECVKTVDQIRRVFTSGYPIVFRYDKTRKSDEKYQYVVFGYSCRNTAAYEIEAQKLVGEMLYDKESFHWTGDGKGWSNADFSLNNELTSNVVAGGEIRYYVQVIYYNPSEYKEAIPMSVGFMSEDKVTKYVYDAVIGG